jgi:hypothetical protein
MHTVVCVNYVQGDTELGDVDRRVNGGSVRDTDILPGDTPGDGICAARRRNRRRDWITAGFDGFRWSDVDVPAEPAGGFNVCDFAAGGVGIGGMQQQFAAGAERGNSGGDIYFVADDNFEWANADFE